jgi:hypothetical protein
MGCARRCRVGAWVVGWRGPPLTGVRAGSVTEMVVATATAHGGNLRFDERQGFRLRSVERDVFGPDTGYPPGLEVDGVPLRERVWLERAIGPDPPGSAGRS